jgi:protocatechuate 3,4-dioxygenase beta subunit
MSDLYKLGQSQQGKVEKVGEEVKLDIKLSQDPFKDTGIVTGIITDPNGPVEGALIKLMDNQHNPLYHALTDATGKYILTGIAPNSDYHFYAVKDGYFLHQEEGFAIVPGQTIEINAEIIPDPDATLSTITAHLYDEEGNPIENMTATLLKIEGQTETPIAVTTTNQYGQCIFANVPLGDYIARATKQGYDPASIEVIITEPGSIINLVGNISSSTTESLGTINGIISDASGQPVPSAVVILYSVTGSGPNETLTPIRYTRTNDAGAYLFGDVPKGDYLVKSNKES